MSALLSRLNPDQKKAVLHEAGPALVLAGAGSGKTTVLTTRVAWLMQEHRVPAHSILVVTFTNKAAGEMKDRIEQMTGSRLPFAGTFHSLCAKILRIDGQVIGLTPNFVIYDTQDQDALVKTVMKELNMEGDKLNTGAVRGAISNAKNELLSPKQFEMQAKYTFQKQVARIYTRYQQALDDAQALDFDDLLVKALRLLKNAPSIREKYQKKFQYVLVDEYQDTNKVQYELTKLFTAPQDNLFVVGDFCQSIYAWRGADYKNMLLLKQDFPTLTEYQLEQNYRSHQTILDAATQVIAENTSHPILKLWTEKPHGEKIVCFEAQSAQEEAQQVVAYIRRHRNQYNYSDMAVLYRTNAQSRAFEEALMQAGIPYTLIGGTKFYERKEIKDVLAYLKYLLNPLDVVSLDRITKLGKRRLQAFEEWRHEQNPDNAKKTDWMSSDPASILRTILDVTTYLQKYDKKTEENISRIENIHELINVAAQFTSVVQFLENVALVQNDYLIDATPEEKDSVNLMSLHAAKGLEFGVVFMVGMEDGLLPHNRSLLDFDQMEEERRLCYVGITRTKDQLYFTYSRSRSFYGVRSGALRSRFLNDIDSSILSIESYAPQQSQNQQSFGNKRRLVLDDELIDGVLHGEIDVDKLIEYD